MKHHWVLSFLAIGLSTFFESVAAGSGPAEAVDVIPRDRVLLTFDYFGAARGENAGPRLPFREDLTSTSFVAASNTLCFFDLLTNQTSSPWSAFTPPVRGPMSLALYPINSRTVAFIAPASAATNRLKAIALGQPHEVLGEFDNVPWADQAGHSVTVGNFWGGPEPEIAITTGAGPVTRVYLGEFGRNHWISFLPFEDSYTGGATLAAGNLLGNSNLYDQFVVSQNRGGRVEVFASTGELIDRLMAGYALGPTPDSGPSVSVFDANNDGQSELILGGDLDVIIADLSKRTQQTILDQIRPAFPPGTGRLEVTTGLTRGRFTIGVTKGPRLATWVWNPQTAAFEQNYDGSPFGPNATPVAFRMITDFK